MRRASVLAVTAGAILLAPQASGAQTQSYKTCSVSGTNFLAGLCFNWDLSHTAGTNTIMLKVAAFGPTTGNLNALAIWLPNFNPSAPGTLTSTSAVNTTTSGTVSTSDWSSATVDPPIGNTAGYDMGVGTGTGNEGICFGAPGGSCWFTPANGYLNFTFTFASTFGTIDLTGAAAGAKWQSIGNSNGPSFDCAYTSSAANYAASFGSCGTSTLSPVPVSTPEPASIILVASGLLGLGVVARRRRTA